MQGTRHDGSEPVRPVRRFHHGDLLRAGETARTLHLGVRGILPVGVPIRFPSRSLAFWFVGSYLVDHRRAPLVDRYTRARNGRFGEMTLAAAEKL